MCVCECVCTSKCRRSSLTFSECTLSASLLGYSSVRCAYSAPTVDMLRVARMGLKLLWQATAVAARCDNVMRPAVKPAQRVVDGVEGSVEGKTQESELCLVRVLLGTTSTYHHVLLIVTLHEPLE